MSSLGQGAVQFHPKGVLKSQKFQTSGIDKVFSLKFHSQIIFSGLDLDNSNYTLIGLVLTLKTK